jgi:hypothetical protein
MDNLSPESYTYKKLSEIDLFETIQNRANASKLVSQNTE